MREDKSRLSTIIAFPFVPFTTTFQKGTVSGSRSDFGNILVVRFEFNYRFNFWQERIMPSTISRQLGILLK